MSDKISALDQYRSTYYGRNTKYQDNEEGTWQVFGEDPNCDMGGHHSNPLLGTYTGRYIDVLSLAVELPSFWQWGAGGYLKKLEIVPVTAGSAKLRQELMQKLKVAEQEVAALKMQLNIK